MSEWRINIYKYKEREIERVKEDLKASFPSVIPDTTHWIIVGGISLTWTERQSLSKITEWWDKKKSETQDSWKSDQNSENKFY